MKKIIILLSMVLLLGCSMAIQDNTKNHELIVLKVVPFTDLGYSTWVGGGWEYGVHVKRENARDFWIYTDREFKAGDILELTIKED